MPKIPYPAKHYLKDGDALKTFSGQKKPQEISDSQ
jgi:hypothetical protein